MHELLLCVVASVYFGDGPKPGIRAEDEVANRDDLFNVAGLKKFNYIASFGFQEERYLNSWKTFLQCEKNVESVKEASRKNDRVSLFL